VRGSVRFSHGSKVAAVGEQQEAGQEFEGEAGGEEGEEGRAVQAQRLTELPDRIYHLALQEHWDNAQRSGEYRQSTLEKTLDEEGFIHCSFEHQVDATKNRFYSGRDDVVRLEIDTTRTPTIKVEGGFPHIYGPLPIDAVVDTRPLRA